MVDWKDYLRQCKADIQSCLLLYDKGYYGNSAYFMQQAIEKTAKMWIYMHNLSDFPVRRHDPLMFMDEIIPQMQAVKEKAERYGIEFDRSRFAARNDSYINQCIGIMNELMQHRNETIKIALWKNSLGIELDDSENELFVRYPDFKSYYRFNLTETIAFTTDTINGDKFMNDVNSSADTYKLGVQRTLVTYGRMIVSAFPHEEYGRYPTDIPTKDGVQTSTKLYEKHKDALKEMIDTVANAVPKDAAAK